MPMQRRGAAVEIAGLRREYVSGQGSVVAIDHVDLGVAPGEFLCIVGPSGCWKSTLLRILAGLDVAPGADTQVIGSVADRALIDRVFGERGIEGKVAAARIAVGACSEVARRLPALERALLGRCWDRTLAAAIEPSHLAGLSPIDDVRAGAAYRRDAAQVLLRRALETMGEAA